MAEKPEKASGTTPTGASAADSTAPGTAPTGTQRRDGRTTDIVPGPGGVMTDEVGVVTGPLTLRTEPDGSGVVIRVQYKDAAEWYTVTGGRTALADPTDLDAVHRIAVGLLNRPEG